MVTVKRGEDRRQVCGSSVVGMSDRIKKTAQRGALQIVLKVLGLSLKGGKGCPDKRRNPHQHNTFFAFQLSVGVKS